MKIHVRSFGETEFPLDAEYGEPEIRAAIDGSSGEDIASTIIDWTDTQRSDISHDEHVTVAEDDGTVTWQGWLAGKPDPDPMARELLDAGDRSQDDVRRELTEARDAELAEVPAGPSPEHPVYRKFVDKPGATPRFTITCDEGWRQHIVCEGMYEHVAGWLVGVLGRTPFAQTPGEAATSE